MKILKVFGCVGLLILSFLVITQMPAEDLFIRVLALFAGFSVIAAVFIVFQGNISKRSYEDDLMRNYVAQHNARAEIARAEIARKETAYDDDANWDVDE